MSDIQRDYHQARVLLAKWYKAHPEDHTLRQETVEFFTEAEVSAMRAEELPVSSNEAGER